ncbi:hypothetical protein PCURB6_00350 [Paenibacillus curdlanolyticus]|nr:hypothetical protein PCURB6_00350 [Paenibacillus curdlanolyticus]
MISRILPGATEMRIAAQSMSNMSFYVTTNEQAAGLLGNKNRVERQSKVNCSPSSRQYKK